MPKIRVDLEAAVVTGQALTFKSPADCSDITGLIIYYPEGNTTTSKVFKFVDAHGVDVGNSTISLFAENVLVKVILDVNSGKAYVQNADTNAYLEGRFDEKSDVGQKHTDPAFTSTKSAPSNSAPYAEVKKIGGMTHRVNVGTVEAPEYVLHSTPVTEVESVGVNLFDLDDFANKNGLVAQSDGSYKGSSFFKEMWVNTNKKAGQIFFSYEGKTENSWALAFEFFYTDGTRSYEAILNPASEFETIVFSSNPNMTVEKIAWTYAHGGDYYVKNMMLSLVDTEYTPYVRNTLPIPEAVRNLDGYGWGVNANCYNYIDFEKKQFVKRVGCVDMGKLAWSKYAGGTGSTFQAAVSGIKTADTQPLRAEGWLCSKYGASTVLTISTLDNKTGLRHSVASIFVRDDDYADAETFKADMSGVMLYYELKNPEITDISDLLPDGAIGVEEGGTVTMVNEYSYDVPNTIDFYLGKNEVIAADTFAGDLVGTASRAVCDKDGNPISSSYAKYADANGSLKANASGQSPSESVLRNSTLVTAETNPTVNGEICWTLE